MRWAAGNDGKGFQAKRPEDVHLQRMARAFLMAQAAYAGEGTTPCGKSRGLPSPDFGFVVKLGVCIIRLAGIQVAAITQSRRRGRSGLCTFAA